MKERIRRIKSRARSYARYVIVGLAVLLFLSVFRASVFDHYLFSLEGVGTDASQRDSFISLLRLHEPALAETLKDAEYETVHEKNRVNVRINGAVIATLEVHEGALYLESGGESVRLGYAREENGRINIYETTTPENEKVWFEVCFILLAAITAEFLVVYVKQPAVMVLLVLGIIISPSAVSTAYPYIASAASHLFSAAGLNLRLTEYIPHLVSTGEGSFISIFATLGSIFLLFEVGLHSEISRIFNKRNFLVAFAGIILPFFGGYVYAVLAGHSMAYSMFLGAALTATSVGVTVAVLQEFKVLEKEFSQVILGAAVIDDILSLLVLSLVKNLPAGGGSMDLESFSPFLTVMIMAGIFVVGGIKMGQYIVRRFFNQEYNGCRIPNATFLGILVYVLTYSYVAEIIGLSAIVGAFLAGVTLNYSKMINRIVESFYPLEAFFTPIFFVSLGMYVDINALFTSIEPILVITVIAVAAKIIACGFTTKITGGSFKDSLIVGIGMVPRGEVALIIGFYGLTTTTASGETVLSAAEYAVIASMAFLTTVIIPLMLQKALEYGGYRT